MTGYTKLFGSIITSTIWREKNETRILWITMLALKNKEGVVEGSVPGLADMARLSLEDTVAALATLRASDPYSRTKEHDGRRIEDVDGGWLVLNHAKWRAKMNADERRDYLRIKQQEHRARMSTPVNKRKRTYTPSTHTEADTDTKEEEKSKRRPLSLAELESFCSSLKLPTSDAETMWAKWNGNGFTNQGKAIRDWKATIRSWKLQGYMPSQKEKYATHNKGSSGESRRNIGTANEGKSSQYAGVGKVSGLSNT